MGRAAADRFFLQESPLPFAHPAGGPDTLSVFQKDIYPYTGGHTQANFIVSPTIRTGDHGFFVDFDLDAPPPPKEPGEIRLS